MLWIRHGAFWMAAGECGQNKIPESARLSGIVIPMRDRLFLEKQKYRILGDFLHFVSYVLVVELFV